MNELQPASPLPNLLTPVSRSPDEFVEQLAAGRGVRIERLVSHGHTTAEGKWYDQPQDEWVALLSGAATLRFEGESSLRELRPGDWLLIPAHARHRVEWTDPAQASVWLAVHFEARDGADQ